MKLTVFGGFEPRYLVSWLRAAARFTVFGGALCCAGAQAANAPAVSEYVLANGLKLIVQEDHRAPVAVVQVWYRVGSSYEYPGITGVSHALEHMMFKGTDDLPAGEFSRIVAAGGGEENAFTSADYTAYYQEWGAEKVALSFELEADRMRDLVLAQEDFDKEIAVVAEERKLRTDDNPAAYAYEVLRATAYETSPYRQPVIGWAEDLEQMALADLSDWYRAHYAPNNAIVVVVGDVDPDEVHALAEQHFGPLKPEPARALRQRTERSQLGTKRVEVRRADVQVPSLMLAFKAPTLPQIARGETDATAEDTYALDVASSILAGDGSARLHNRLVRGDAIATSVQAGYSSVSRLGALFYLIATPAPGTSLDALEQRLLAELRELAAAPPTEDEMARVKAQTIAQQMFERDSPSYQANVIGSLEAVGLPWSLKEAYVDNLSAVTAEAVSDVVARFLVPQRLTIGHLLPEGI